MELLLKKPEIFYNFYRATLNWMGENPGSDKIVLLNLLIRGP